VLPKEAGVEIVYGVLQLAVAEYRRLGRFLVTMGIQESSCRWTLQKCGSRGRQWVEELGTTRSLEILDCS
jgi:hypothetical protein